MFLYAIVRVFPHIVICWCENIDLINQMWTTTQFKIGKEFPFSGHSCHLHEEYVLCPSYLPYCKGCTPQNNVFVCSPNMILRLQITLQSKFTRHSTPKVIAYLWTGTIHFYHHLSRVISGGHHKSFICV